MGAELIIGAVTAGAGAAMSFSQAKQQRVLADRAQAAATKAMEEAKSQLKTNYLEELSLPTKAYDVQREAINQQGADILASVSQGEDRGVAAAAGKVMAARTQAERELTGDIQKQMFELDKLKAAEDQRIGQTLASLSLQEVEGAQLAQREAMAASARATTSGINALGNFASSAIQASNPYLGQKDNTNPPGGGGQKGTNPPGGSKPFDNSSQTINIGGVEYPTDKVLEALSKI